MQFQGLQRKQAVSSENIETGGGGFMRFWRRLGIDGESKSLFSAILTDLYW